MQFNLVQRAIIDALEKIKARDLVAFDVRSLTALYDLVVIATADSARQTKSLANLVREEVKKVGGHVLGSEGEESGDWVLVDCNEAVVHILQPAVRTYYHLEDLWDTSPIDIAAAMREAPAPASKRAPPKAPKRKAVKRSAERAEASALPALKTPKKAVKKSTKTAVKRATKRAAAPDQIAAPTSLPKRPSVKKASTTRTGQVGPSGKSPVKKTPVKSAKKTSKR